MCGATRYAPFMQGELAAGILASFGRLAAVIQFVRRARAGPGSSSRGRDQSFPPHWCVEERVAALYTLSRLPEAIGAALDLGLQTRRSGCIGQRLTPRWRMGRRKDAIAEASPTRWANPEIVASGALPRSRSSGGLLPMWGTGFPGQKTSQSARWWPPPRNSRVAAAEYQGFLQSSDH